MTPAQCRAARALLDWSQQQLAGAARVGVVTVRQFEGAAAQARNSTLDVMQRALETAGVVFVAENGDGPGVRLRKQRQDRKNLDQHIQHLEGEVARLKPAASGKASSAKGMAMLRGGRAKSDLAEAKNKRAKAPK